MIGRAQLESSKSPKLHERNPRSPINRTLNPGLFTSLGTDQNLRPLSNHNSPFCFGSKPSCLAVNLIHFWYCLVLNLRYCLQPPLCSPNTDPGTSRTDIYGSCGSGRRRKHKNVRRKALALCSSISARHDLAVAIVEIVLGQ